MTESTPAPHAKLLAHIEWIGKNDLLAIHYTTLQREWLRGLRSADISRMTREQRRILNKQVHYLRQATEALTLADEYRRQFEQVPNWSPKLKNENRSR